MFREATAAMIRISADICSSKGMAAHNVLVWLQPNRSHSICVHLTIPVAALLSSFRKFAGENFVEYSAVVRPRPNEALKIRTSVRCRVSINAEHKSADWLRLKTQCSGIADAAVIAQRLWTTANIKIHLQQHPSLKRLIASKICS
jgi:hypothetical protein